MIKPCPFCGGPADAYEDSSSDYRRDWQWQVICHDRKNCWADSPYGNTREEAIAAWNKRPIEDALAAKVAELENFIMVAKIRGDWWIEPEKVSA